jgi:hypothetical protein
MRLVNSISKGKRRVYDIEVDEVHNFYANGLNVHNCATNGGVSVIKDDGTVVDLTTTIYTVASSVDFTPEDNLIFALDNVSNTGRYVHVHAIPAIDTLIGANGYDKGSSLEFYTARVASNPDLYPSAVLAPQRIIYADDTLGGSDTGLARLLRNTTTPDNGSVAYLTSDYNTGYMTGDIKGAWNVDTDVTTLGTSSDPVVGQNLISNGTFSSDTSGWSISHYAGRSTHNVASGYFHVEGNSSADSAWSARFLMSNGTVSSGAKYQISFDIRSNVAMYTSSSGTGYASWVNLGGTFTEFSDVSSTGGSWVTRTFIATAGSANSGAAELRFGQDAPDISTGKYVDIDNVSIKVLGIPDRSVNANGLAVHGTPIVSAVATGAELKCISGFSASNYLEQPYNSDLDFGTGDFSIMGWYNVSASGILVERGNRGVSNTPGFYLWSNGSNTLRFETSANNFVTTFRLDGTLVENVWQYVTALRRSGVMYLYINGVLQGTLASTVNLTNTTAITAFGVASDGSVVLSGSLALWRISATAPTAAQIKEIYEAEKPLFQENGKCVLHGTSDAVTALAYDDSTSELVVATSGGLSVFKGLSRVDEEDGNFTEVSQQGGMRITEKA